MVLPWSHAMLLSPNLFSKNPRREVEVVGEGCGIWQLQGIWSNLAAAGNLAGAGSCNGVSPNDRSLVSMLQVLGNLADKEVDQIAAKLKFLQKGKAVHTESLRSGLAADVFVCNALLSMYAKCGSVLDAQDLFDRLSHRDVVSWNGLLAGYAQQGQGQMTFQLYHEMKGESVVSPDAGTFVILLRACSNLNEGDNIDLVDERSVIVSSLQKCKAIHADASRRGLEQDVFFSSTLISLYTKCGSLVDATRFFDGLTEPDVVSWNAILAGHAQQGNGEKVLNLYGKMQESGVSPDAWTFVSALQACGTMVSQTGSTVLVDEELFQMHSLQQGRGLHADCQRRGYNLFGFVGNALVSMYGRCGSIVDAQNVFAGLAQRDVVSWNALLAAYVQQNQGKKAFQLFYQMQKEMVTPDSRTFVSLVQACSCLAEEEDVFLEGQSLRAESLRKGKAVHTEVQRRCYESEVFVVNSLITMYAKCGSTLDAHQMFDGLSHRTVVSWNAMLAAYAQEGEGHKSLTLYRQMLMEDVEPDESTFVCILQVCANIGALDICQQIHQCLVSDGKKLSPVVASTLILSYGKLGRMEAALDVFEILRNSNIVTWTALIAGYAREGNYEQSLQCYEDMQLAGVKPNELTFCSLLSACSHAGMVDKGLDYFKSMITDYSITPETEHYVSIVDLLGRAGFFTLLEGMLSKMPTQPDASMWLCILNSCRKHGNVALGKRAFDCAVRLQPHLADAYFLMSNIYSQAGMFDRARKVHELRELAGLWKKPGQTWVQHAQEVRTFLVEERGHPDDEHIYDLVGKLRKELEAE